MTPFSPAAGTRRSSRLESQRGHRTASVAWAGVRVRPREVVFQPRWAEFAAAATPSQRAKGFMQQASLYSQQWSLQRGMHSVKNLRDPRKRFDWLFCFSRLKCSPVMLRSRPTGISCESLPQEGSWSLNSELFWAGRAAWPTLPAKTLGTAGEWLMNVLPYLSSSRTWLSASRDGSQPPRKHSFHSSPQTAAVPGAGVGKHQPPTGKSWQTFITKGMGLFCRWTPATRITKLPKIHANSF